MRRWIGPGLGVVGIGLLAIGWWAVPTAPETGSPAPPSSATPPGAAPEALGSAPPTAPTAPTAPTPTAAPEAAGTAARDLADLRAGDDELVRLQLTDAEAHFEAGDAAMARDAYQLVVDEASGHPMAPYARYKLAWTLRVLDEHPAAVEQMVEAVEELAGTSDDRQLQVRDTARDDIVAWLHEDGEPEVADTVRALWDHGEDDSAAELLAEVVAGG